MGRVLLTCVWEALSTHSVHTSRWYEAINKANPIGKKNHYESQKEIVKYDLPQVEAMHK